MKLEHLGNVRLALITGVRHHIDKALSVVKNSVNALSAFENPRTCDLEKMHERILAHELAADLLPTFCFLDLKHLVYL